MMEYKKIFLKFLVLTLVTVLNISCFLADPIKSLMPPVTFPLSRSVIGYVIITDSYTQLLDKVGSDAVSLGVLRQGTILPVLERRILPVNDKMEVWLQVSSKEIGWIKETVGRVFDTEAQAETALKKYVKGP